MKDSRATSGAALAEVQGLYGAFSFPEKLLQKIWLRGDFDRAGARTIDGRAVRIRHPGKWNLLGGPDFTGARVRFDSAAAPEITGDIEVHLHAEDWAAHGHARDPAYDRVILHVVLFPPEAGHRTIGAGGREIPVLALLPLLHCGLEEFAADEAVETLANRPLARVPEELGALPAPALDEALRRHATARWSQKVRFARLRVERLGWEAACHHAALEILGYRFNRAPMLRVAGRAPLAAWRDHPATAEEMFAEEREGWSLHGVRPANHVRVRLRQYGTLVAEQPDWPARLRELAPQLPSVELTAPTGDVRRKGRFRPLREAIRTDLLRDAIGGTRIDTMICDGFLPLLAAVGSEAEGVWFHWYPGDLPSWLTSGLRHLGYRDGRTRPTSQGAAQGLLGWMLAREAKP